MSINEPIRQHYVPKLYLKSFSVDGKVHIYDKQDKKYYQASPDSICQQKNYYTLEGLDNKYAWEYLFAKILEPHLSTTISYVSLLSSLKVIPQDVPLFDYSVKEVISIDLLFQLIRTPTFKSVIDSIIPEIERLSIENILDNNLDYTEDIIRSSGLFDERVIKVLFFKYFNSLSFMKPGMGVLAKKKWTILHITDEIDYSFITNDNPVTIYDPKYRPGNIFKIGLEDPFISIIYPFDAKTCLLLYNDNSLFVWPDCCRIFINNDNLLNYVDIMNSRIFESANRFVISNKKFSIK